MTALTSASAAPVDVAADYRLTFGRTLRSEAIKIFTLRSTGWALGVGILLSAALPFTLGAFSAAEHADLTAHSMVQAALVFVQLVLPVFGVLAITKEFSTGSIRTSLTAQPSRATLVLAKAIVLAAVAVAASLVTYAVVLGATLPFVSEGLDFSSPETSTLPILTGLLSTLVFTFVGFGLGLIIRNAGGAITATVVVLYVLPIALGMVWLRMSGGDPNSGVFNFSEVLPTQASSMLAYPEENSPFVPLCVMGVWMVTPTLVGAVLLRRRDV